MQGHKKLMTFHIIEASILLADLLLLSNITILCFPIRPTSSQSDSSHLGLNEITLNNYIVIYATSFFNGNWQVFFAEITFICFAFSSHAVTSMTMAVLTTWSTVVLIGQ